MKLYTLRRPLQLAFALILSIFPALLHAQQVIISEIMYNPSGIPENEEDIEPEYIEIRNNSATPYDIADWKFTDGIEYAFPSFSSSTPEASFLREFETILISAVSETDLRAVYTIPAGVRVFGPWTGSLANNGERITLKDKNKVIISTVRYEDQDRWSPAADGAGHSVHVQNTNHVVDDFRNWGASVEPGGSPGSDEPVDNDPPLALSEVNIDADGKIAWVEVYNPGTASVDLSTYSVSVSPEHEATFALGGVLASGGYASVMVDQERAGDDATVFLLGQDNQVRSAARIDRPASNSSAQAFPAGSTEWYNLQSPTRDAANEPERMTQIVINEIMAEPMVGTRGEFIEFYNNGTTPVNMSGWSVEGGVGFVFPPNAEIQPGGYIVIAADEAFMRDQYANISLAGRFEGVISNGGELIRLLDTDGNLADEVDFKVEGDWPLLAAGLGSSLELTNPGQDNSRSSAWRSSDESEKSEFRQYSYTGVYENSFWGPNTDEFHIHMVGDGYMILENFEVKGEESLFNPNPMNVIEDGDKESTDGRGGGWLFQGTHWRSYLDDESRIHVISEGRGDNRANRGEVDTSGLSRGGRYTISFSGRWVNGRPRLITQSFNHRLAHDFLIDVPENLGTPGRVNSTFTDTPAPQLDDLKNTPAVPGQGETVTVTARVVADPSLDSVTLNYILDSEGSAPEDLGSLFNPRQSSTMVDDGTNGDALAGDGIYTGQITGLGSDGDVVQFFVEAKSTDGAVQRMPRNGLEAPGFYVIDDKMTENGLTNMRVVTSAYFNDSMVNGNSAKFDFKHPPTSNRYYPATVIMSESEVYHGAVVRPRGSPWHRRGTNDSDNTLRVNSKYKLPRDRWFRGFRKMNWDDDPTGGNRHMNDRVVRYWLYLLGQPVSENEFVNLRVGSTGTVLREFVEPVANGLLERVYPDNGLDGQLYRVDDEWSFTDTWAQTSNDADWGYKDEFAASYHSEWALRTRESEYDYSSLIELFRVMTENDYTQAQVDRIIDTDLNMKMIVGRGWIGDWDWFGIRRGKNSYFYRHPGSGKFMWWHWDSDLGFSGGEPFYNGAGNGAPFRNWVNQPYNKRVFNYYLQEMVEEWTDKSPRFLAWLDAEEDASDAYSARKGNYESFNRARVTRARTQLGNTTSTPFAVSNNGGNAFDTEDHVITLTGSASAEVWEPFVVDHPEAKVRWISETEWEMTNVVLAEGENDLQLKAYDRAGRTLGSLFKPLADSIVINKTTPSIPVLDIDSDPGSYTVAAGEALSLDPGDSFDPEGDDLTIEWSASGEHSINVDEMGVAAIIFPNPGIYTVTLTASDPAQNTASVTREIAVYGANGFSNFADIVLESHWNLENVDLKTSSEAPASIGFDRPESNMTLFVLDEQSLPLTGSSPTYPTIARDVPAGSDWVFQTDLNLTAQQFGEFDSGLFIDTNAGGTVSRYTFGFHNGDEIAVYQVGDGSPQAIHSEDWDDENMTIRVERTGNQLVFGYRSDGEWTDFSTVDLAVSTETTQAGLFTATNARLRTQSSFDYALLVNPGAVSGLSDSIRLTELMYNPPEGGALEWLELTNISAGEVALTGAAFIDGINYTFNETTLAANASLVLAKNPDAFTAKYGAGPTVMGGYEGQLANGGETITLVDAQQQLVFSVAYGDEDGWPTEADGGGSSIELIDAASPAGDPGNWRAVADGGNPGEYNAEPIEGDADGDGMPDDWENLYGFDPNNAADASMDSDGDGSLNLQEYLANTLPNDAGSYLTLKVARQSNGNIMLRFTAQPNRRHALEFIDTLANAGWTEFETYEAGAQAVDQSREVTTDSGQQFFRLTARP